MTAQRGDYNETLPQTFLQPLWQESADKKHRLGTRRVLDDGREFVYCQAGTTALEAAKLCASAITVNAEDTLTVNTTAGGKSVTITEAGQAGGITANQFQDGFLVADAGTGIGEIFKIASHAAIANAGTGNIELYDAFDTALTTGTNVTLYTNPYKAVVVANVAATIKPVCVPQRPVAANYYFWGQVKGLGSLILDVNSAAGAELDEKTILISTNHDGLGMPVASPAAGTNYHGHHEVGDLIRAADHTDNEAALVYLAL
jgi:hypothetical protein